MAKQIEFDSLFNKGSFDAGVSELVKVIGKITEEIELAELAGRMLSETLGKKLKGEISSISSVSKTLSKDLSDMAKKMEEYKIKTVQIDKVTESYKKETERLTKELDKLKLAQEKANKETDKASGATNKAKTSYAGLAQSFLGVASGAALVHDGIRFLKEQIISAVQSTIAFEKVMKEVQAVSGATGDELKLLTDNANKLGSTTEKTAQQIAEAQKELAKLGFTTPEILLATSAIIDLSTATGEDLVKTAEVAASTIRSFGLEVSDLAMVTDVMTKSFIISALDLEKFRESIKLVAPIAAATNIGIETVTAALAKLSDTGISGSLAGTAMRNLISSMADPTEDLVKFLGQYDQTLINGVKSSEDFTRALQVLKGANIDLETAVGMVDVRARSAFFTLVNYADDVEYLALELKYLNGETQEVAKTMRESLAIDIEIANSAFDSMRRNMVEEYIPAMKEVTKTTTTIIEAIRLFNEGIIFHNSFIADATSKYIDWVVAMNPIVFTFNRLTEVLGLVGVEWSDLVNTVEGGKFSETLTSTDMNLTKMIEGFEKFDGVSRDYNQANAILNAGNAETSEGVQQLRDRYTLLSSATSDNVDFLKRVRGEAKKQIDATYGYITALKAEEEIYLKLIKTTKESLKTDKENAVLLGILADADRVLVNIRNLRFAQEEKMLESSERLRTSTEDFTSAMEKLYESERKLIPLRSQLSAIYAKMREEQAKFALEEEKNLISKIPLLNAYKDARVAVANDALTAELNSIKYSEDSEEERILKREIAYANHTKELTKISRDYGKEMDGLNTKLLENDDKLIELLNKNRKEKSLPRTKEELKKFGQQVLDSQTEAFKKSIGLAKKQSEEREDGFDKANQDAIDKEEEKWDNIIEKAEYGAQKLSEITTMMFDRGSINRANELTAIDAWEKERISLAGDNEEAISAIEKEATEKRNKVKTEQAKADRKEAMFQIAINTALAVMKAVAQSPLTLGLPWSAIVAGIGVAQMAIVASRPLPKFEKGTDFSPEGRAIVGERGRELIKDGKSGNWRMSSDRASETYLSRGSKVIPAHITAKLLESGGHDHNGIAEQYLNKLSKKEEKELFDYNELGKQFRGAVADIPVNQTNFDENGVTRFTIKRNSKIQRLNKKY